MRRIGNGSVEPFFVPHPRRDVRGTRSEAQPANHFGKKALPAQHSGVATLNHETELPTIGGIPQSLRDRFGDAVNDLIQPKKPMRTRR